MGDSAGTSDFAASTDATCSRPVSSGVELSTSQRAAAPDLRVEFHILGESSAHARLKLACRLAERAYLENHRALVWDTDEQELRAFDELLWTFRDGSFVPHETLVASGSQSESPVLLSSGAQPPCAVDLIINLSSDLPACLAQTAAVAEIVDGDEPRRRAGRARFKAYRDLGVQPITHNVGAE